MPVFWDVEECFCLAHRGHGSVQDQLPALRRAKVMVRSLTDPSTAWMKGSPSHTVAAFNHHVFSSAEMRART